MRILTINAGSSSLKAARYDMTGGERRTYALEAERIGQSGGRLRVTRAAGETLLDRRQALPDHAAALRAFVAWTEREGVPPPDAIGHRIVHGGRRHRDPEALTEEVMADLDALAPIDPDHLPQSLAVVRAAGEIHPGIPAFACFDTAFHQTMPAVAESYPLPSKFAGDADIIRYGFHGLSCEYIVGALASIDPAAASGRVVIAHLGNGASLTAVRDGLSLDTTMGFTPTGGLVMGTRSGDLDPGVLLYLMRAKGLSADDVSRLVNHDAGLAGVSGLSGDMRDLLDRESADPRAARAIALFCYAARKFLGSLVAVLGGLDTLVFTGGIGEHAAPIRARIASGFDFLGLDLDPARNDRHEPVISRDGSHVIVRVMPTNEDVVIARHVRRLLAAS
ncbi:MAG TPA: acetate/propionate family kinase [Vicinamibacterales bacterium]|jgi:acetate kinase|nr:acetate/propionate family kinase [Vicinamibacterales bacterium]